MNDLPKIRVAVVRGGESSDFEASLSSGEHILSILRADEARFDPVDIFVSREGEWHAGGLPVRPLDALKRTDLVWNASRGAVRELEMLHMPFIGSGRLSSGMAGNAGLSRVAYSRLDLPSPLYREIKADYQDRELMEVFRTFMHPVSVRPAESLSEPTVAQTFGELEQAVKNVLSSSKRAIVEEYMKGKRIVSHVLKGGRGEKFYAFLPAEIADGRHILPSTASVAEHKKIEEMSKAAHEALGLGSYSSTSFLITPKGKIYILGTDALPDVSKNSLFMKSIRATGWQPKEFVDHAISFALDK